MQYIITSYTGQIYKRDTYPLIVVGLVLPDKRLQASWSVLEAAMRDDYSDCPINVRASPVSIATFV